MVVSIGIEPMPSGVTPTLSMSFDAHLLFSGIRHRRPARTSRDLSEPEPLAEAKDAATTHVPPAAQGIHSMMIKIYMTSLLVDDT
ncbi:hypothetical protein ACRAVF_22635 [Bradyrhizobium oligotrophicum S58]